MSEPISALNHVSFDGFANIREIGPLGMISLRATADLPGLADAVRAATGCDLPGVRRIVTNGASAAGWMSPDEYLLILPYDRTGAAMAAIGDALKGQHHLAVVVSDARAVFRVDGEKAAQVIAKLCPVDLETLAPGELRRSRTAQVAAAFWRDEAGFTLVCFRSVAGYVFDLLRHSALHGSELTPS